MPQNTVNSAEFFGILRIFEEFCVTRMLATLAYSFRLIDTKNWLLLIDEKFWDLSKKICCGTVKNTRIWPFFARMALFGQASWSWPPPHNFWKIFCYPYPIQMTLVLSCRIWPNRNFWLFKKLFLLRMSPNPRKSSFLSLKVVSCFVSI